MTTALDDPAIRAVITESFVRKGMLSVVKWVFETNGVDVVELRLSSAKSGSDWLLGSILEFRLGDDGDRRIVEMELTGYGKPLRFGPMPPVYGMEMQRFYKGLLKEDPTASLDRL